MTQTCVRQSDLGATKHTPMVRYPLVLLNPTINTKFSCGKCEKLMVVQQLVPGTKTGSFTLLFFCSPFFRTVHFFFYTLRSCYLFKMFALVFFSKPALLFVLKILYWFFLSRTSLTSHFLPPAILFVFFSVPHLYVENLVLFFIS